MEIKEGIENDKLLSIILADEIRRTRKIVYPNADDILNSLGNTKVVMK